MTIQELAQLMLLRQENGGNPRNPRVFLKNMQAGKIEKGFVWSYTPEGGDWWTNTIGGLQDTPVREQRKADLREEFKRLLEEAAETKGEFIINNEKIVL